MTSLGVVVVFVFILIVLHGAKLQYEYNVHHVVFWSLQLLLGLQYIHLCNLIHRDVKSSKCVLPCVPLCVCVYVLGVQQYG